MTLRQARCAFTKALCELVLWAYEQGYEVNFDEVTERVTEKDPTSDHMLRSLHHIGLAADLNLFLDDDYLENTSDHAMLGAKWVQLGQEKGLPLVWGGDFGDGNHYSLAWNGRK